MIKNVKQKEKPQINVVLYLLIFIVYSFLSVQVIYELIRKKEMCIFCIVCM